MEQEHDCDEYRHPRHVKQRDHAWSGEEVTQLGCITRALRSAPVFGLASRGGNARPQRLAAQLALETDADAQQDTRAHRVEGRERQ